jgi:myo-inositol-hexaphosphate 3-phosphohydrolase
VARLRPTGLAVLSALALSLILGAGPSAAAIEQVRARDETRPVPHGGDAADDPAIWVAGRRSRSTIIGTDKQGGIAVYTLGGRQIQYRRDGRLNNVDLRRGFPLGGGRVTLVTATNRSNNTIAVYRVDPGTRRLVRVPGSFRAGIGVYGLCMYRSPGGRYYVFITSASGRVEQWQLTRSGNGVGHRRVRRFDVGSDSEGCVADDSLRRLYIGEEGVGIWRYRADPGRGHRRRRIDRTGGSGHLEADVEGLAIARTGHRRGYLIASSQGNSTFVVYGRRTNRYVKTFEIVGGRRTDGVSDTDGIEVTTARLGRAFPSGLFVAQDGNNNRPRHQNFKLVAWRAIARA